MAFKLKHAAISIIVINVVIFMAQMVLGSWFIEMFLLVSAEVVQRPWILLTSMFLHADPAHLLFNMYALFIFGPLIEQRIGAKRFLIAYFASGLLAAALSTFFYTRALGASGAIMGILGITIVLMPDLRVLLFFAIPMSLRTAGIIFAAIDIIGVFTPGGGVANIAHLVGLGVGLLYGYYLLRQRKGYQKRFMRHSYAAQPRRAAASSTIELSQEDIDDYLKHGRL
jgi:hypothetical protein